MRHSSPDEPGIRRIRSGKGFTYKNANGAKVSDKQRGRIEALVIPPAWREVWICKDPGAHLQATGIDEAGRTQYLYHGDWRKERDAAKFERVAALARRLPVMRRAVERDLKLDGFPQERTVALVLRLLDTGRLRIGSSAYEEENGSHGASTLLVSHVHVTKHTVRLEFPAKSNQNAQVSLTDPSLAKAMAALRRGSAANAHLMRYRDGSEWHELTAGVVGDRFKTFVGDAYSVKDLRTWAATVTAAEELGKLIEDPDTDADTATKLAVEAAAESLGDTTTVARASYIDPRVFSAYTMGRTVKAPRQTRLEHSPAVRRKVELQLLRLLDEEGPAKAVE